MGTGFSSDQAAAIYAAAVRQGWRKPRAASKSNHLHLFCPDRNCAYMAAFSLSGRYRGRELQNQIAQMRRHGLVWDGRPATHTAPRLNRKATKA